MKPKPITCGRCGRTVAYLSGNPSDNALVDISEEHDIGHTQQDLKVLFGD